MLFVRVVLLPLYWKTLGPNLSLLRSSYKVKIDRNQIIQKWDQKVLFIVNEISLLFHFMVSCRNVTRIIEIKHKRSASLLVYLTLSYLTNIHFIVNAYIKQIILKEIISSSSKSLERNKKLCFIKKILKSRVAICFY